MSRICGECDQYVENPIYAMSAVIWDAQHTRLAFSDMEISLCPTELCRVSTSLLRYPKDMNSFLGYAIDVVTGTFGGRGTVQISGAYERHGQYRFLEREAALQNLPRSAQGLLQNPEWIEHVDGEWKEASWAQELMKRASS